MRGNLPKQHQAGGETLATTDTQTASAKQLP